MNELASGAPHSIGVGLNSLRYVLHSGSRWVRRMPEPRLGIDTAVSNRFRRCCQRGYWIGV